MKVLVTGDREWTDRGIIYAVLAGTYEWWRGSFSDMTNEDEVFEVVEGHARGADKIAYDWALMMEGNDKPVQPRSFPAKWNEYGRAAGPIRNKKMLEQSPDVVFAFHDDLENSKGTAHMIKIAKDAGVKVYHIRSVQ